MTEASVNTANVQQAGKISFWSIVLGVIVVLAGMLAAANLFAATFVSVLFVGAMMIVGGALEIVHSFGLKSWGSFILWFLTGVCYTIAGILTLFIAISLITAGVARIFAGISQRRSGGWGWMVAAGLVTLLVGLLIFVRWPVNSLWVIGIFLAADLMLQGLAYITYGLGLRQHPAGD